MEDKASFCLTRFTICGRFSTEKFRILKKKYKNVPAVFASRNQSLLTAKYRNSSHRNVMIIYGTTELKKSPTQNVSNTITRRFAPKTSPSSHFPQVVSPLSGWNLLCSEMSLFCKIDKIMFADSENQGNKRYFMKI